MPETELKALIARTIDRPVPAAIRAMADHVRSQCGFNVEAVLAYGSCLRGVDPGDSPIDLYVLTADRSGMAHLSRIGCRSAPPNVYYAEMAYEGRRLRAKYAALPLKQFAARMRAANPYFWARFAQPSALLFAKYPEPVIAALAQAATTMFAHAKALPSPSPPRLRGGEGRGEGAPPRENSKSILAAPPPHPTLSPAKARGRGENMPSLAIWETGFRATYTTELRPEGPDRAAGLVAANADFYEAAARLLADTPAHPANWPLLRITGKVLSLARLAKAAFTFQGGADYIAWKIERHSGEKIVLSDWQKNHPILAGAALLPRLLRRGAVR